MDAEQAGDGIAGHHALGRKQVEHMVGIGLVLAGRIGAKMTAEIGTMTVTDAWAVRSALIGRLSTRAAARSLSAWRSASRQRAVTWFSPRAP